MSDARLWTFGLSDPAMRFVGSPTDGSLIQIPGSGVIWKICPTPPAPGGGDQADQVDNEGGNSN